MSMSFLFRMIIYGSIRVTGVDFTLLHGSESTFSLHHFFLTLSSFHGHLHRICDLVILSTECCGAHIFSNYSFLWQPTLVFFLGKSHGQRSLVGYSPWGCKESDMTQRLTHTHNHFKIENEQAASFNLIARA